MDEREDIGGEYRRPSFSPIRIRHLAPSPIKKGEVDKSDEGDEDNSEQITAVESPIMAEPRSGDSGPPSLEDLKEHGREDTELRVGESSPPSPEAKGDHPDGEDDKTEMVDEWDEEGDEDNSGEITAVESSEMAQPRSSNSGSCIADLKGHGQDDPDLRVGESSPPPPEAKGGHPDGEDEDKPETPDLSPSTSSAEPQSTRSANRENDTEDNRMSSLDISTMEMAIKSGDPKAVDDLMERWSDTLAVDELTATYGGRYLDLEADEDGLFEKTSPILHAARSGNLAVFESVMKAMQAKLSLEKVKEMLAKKDIMGQSLLSLAALSGSKDVLESVLLVIRREFIESEVKDMLAERDENGDSLLLKGAARSGSKDVLEHVLRVIRGPFVNENVLEGDERAAFSLLASAVRSGSMAVVEHVLSVIRLEFSENAVNEILQSTDSSGASLPACAASSGNSNIFKTVLNLVTVNLEEDKKRDMLKSNDGDGATLLALAVSSGNRNTFETVLETVTDCLTKDEVKGMLTSKDKWGDSALARAVKSKCRDTFEGVLHVVTCYLTIDEIKNELRAKDKIGDSLLMHAAIRGRRILFEAVLAVLKSNLPEEQVKEMILCTDKDGDGLLVSAVLSGRVEMFKAVIATISDNIAEEEVKRIISSRNNVGASLLLWVIITKSVEMLKAVMVAVVDNLPEEEIKNELRAKDEHGRSLLAYAAYSGRIMFEAVLATLRSNLPEEQVKSIISSRDEGGDSLLVSAVESMSVEMFKAVMAVVVDNLPEEEMLEMLCHRRWRLETPIDIVIWGGDLDLCDIVLQVAQDNLVDKKTSSVREKVAEALDASFLLWASRYQSARQTKDEGEIVTCKRILSLLFKRSAYPRKTFFQSVAQDVTGAEERAWEHFTELVLSGVESADNPLVPGMAVSVALAEATEGAREGKQIMFSSLQKKVDNLMLKILHRLPQTVRGFKQGMSQCSALFEPEGPRNDPCGRPGPLRVGLERREHTKKLCEVALLMDYLYRRFMNDLPDMRDSGRVLQDVEELRSLAKGEDGNGFILGGIPGDTHGEQHPSGYEPVYRRFNNAMNRPPPGDFKDVEFFRVWLQGANATRPSLTFLPGAQFIIAGLLAKPNNFYRVPVMRMVLDFAVYIIMLALYSAWVLLHEDGPLTIGEIIFACYILGAALKEGSEMGRDLVPYLQDRWNVLDLLAIGALAGGFSVRLADSGSSWGRALYALSAPLVFSRALFYAQYLPFQGSMVEVIFGMTIVLLQFLVVLLVILLGFAFALFPLLRDADNFTFGDVLLLLFKTLLGDVEVFEEFHDTTQNRYASVGQLLLVLYLLVMTIMLLNLLIAVLSTAHAKVELNADKELEVSKVRIVEHYRLVVALDILPAPFNLVQFVFTLPFILMGQRARRRSTIRRTIERRVGQVSFWLIVSPVVVAAGTILWVSSGVRNFLVPATELVRRVPTASTIRNSLRRAVRNPFKWVTLIPLGLYSLLFPRELFRSFNRLTKWNAVRVHIAVWGVCTLAAPLCLLYLWLRGPCLCIYQVVIALKTFLGFEGNIGGTNRTPSSRQDNEEPNGQNTPGAVRGGNHSSRQERAQTEMCSLLKSVGVGTGELLKYVENPIVDPEVWPDEVGRVSTVEHIKLLRNLMEERFFDLEKKFRHQSVD